MGGRQLSTGEIRDLLTFKHNMDLNVSGIQPAFDKQQTLQIISAVSDGFTITDDGLWSIKYFRDGERFSVGPSRPFKFTPCGHFTTNDVLNRLSL